VVDYLLIGGGQGKRSSRGTMWLISKPAMREITQAESTKDGHYSVRLRLAAPAAANHKSKTEEAAPTRLLALFQVSSVGKLWRTIYGPDLMAGAA
jgi:hypothetical protein